MGKELFIFYALYPIWKFIRSSNHAPFATSTKGGTLDFFLFLGFLASVGSPHENFSSPLCGITFQKHNLSDEFADRMNLQIGYNIMHQVKGNEQVSKFDFDDFEIWFWYLRTTKIHIADVHSIWVYYYFLPNNWPATELRGVKHPQSNALNWPNTVLVAKQSGFVTKPVFGQAVGRHLT